MNTIIIVEGPQGVGKTTVTNYLREMIPYTNLYRLTGHSDETKKGLKKSKKAYLNLLNYINSLTECDLNLLFDRTFISEEVYCRLGYRQYEFTPIYRLLMDYLNNLEFHIVVFNLTCENIILEERLKRDKPQHLRVNFSLETSLNQLTTYKKVTEELRQYHNIKVYDIDTSSEEIWKVKTRTILENTCKIKFIDHRKV